MSRSRKKAKHMAISGLASMVPAKQFTNRKLRRNSKMRIEANTDPESYVMPLAREQVGRWNWGKDGFAGVKGEDPRWDKYWRK